MVGCGIRFVLLGWNCTSFFFVSCFNLFGLLCCAEQLFVGCEFALFVRVLPLERECLVQGSDHAEVNDICLSFHFTPAH